MGKIPVLLLLGAFSAVSQEISKLPDGVIKAGQSCCYPIYYSGPPTAVLGGTAVFHVYVQTDPNFQSASPFSTAANVETSGTFSPLGPDINMAIADGQRHTYDFPVLYKPFVPSTFTTQTDD